MRNMRTWVRAAQYFVKNKQKSKKNPKNRGDAPRCTLQDFLLTTIRRLLLGSVGGGSGVKWWSSRVLDVI